MKRRLFIILLLLVTCVFGQNAKDRILLIHSYGASFPTYHYSMEAFQDIIDDDGTYFQVYLLESKGYQSKVYEKYHYDLLKYKIEHTAPFDLIYLADDYALNFYTKYEDDIFDGVPAVFYGINDYQRAVDASHDHYCTGVIEQVSVNRTVDLAVSLNENLETVYILSDNTLSGRLDRQNFLDATKSFKDLEFVDVNLGEYSYDELADYLGSLSRSGSAIVYLSAYVDRYESYMDFEQSIQYVVSASSCPVYTLWFQGLNHGVVGGCLVYHYLEAQKAIAIGNRILNGESPKDIPVELENPNSVYVDYKVARYFDLDANHLSSDVIIINIPAKTMKINYLYVFFMVFIITALTAMILVILAFLRRSRQTEKKLQKALTAVDASEKKFRAYIQASPLYIYITDQDGKINFVNTSAKQALDYSEAQLLQMNIRDFFPEANKEYSMKIYQEFIKTGAVIEAHHKLQSKKGEVINVLIDATIVRDGVYVTYCQNVNDLFLAQEQLRSTLSKQKHINMELSAAKNKAEESDRLKSAFLSNMSHEIRTPMNAILGFSGLLDRELNQETFDTFITSINNAGNQLLTLIDDILDISKIESGVLQLKMDNYHLSDLLYQVYEVNLYSDRYKDKPQLTLNFNSSCLKDIVIETDHVRFHQILNNLVQNAIKFTQTGSVEIGYTCFGKSDDHVRVFVKDTGLGIYKNDQKRIFERFIQVSDGGYKEGTGLGLSITKGLVELLGGHIYMESEPGSGSTFFLEFPVCHDHGVEVKDSEPLVMEAEYDFSRYLIFIAEDDEASGVYLTELLKDTGVETKIFFNGADLLLGMEEQLPDLVLMDINMPSMDGYEAVERIRRDHRHLPVIAQTAYAMPEEREKILSSGFDNYISKPIRRKELLHKISLLLSKEN